LIISEQFLKSANKFQIHQAETEAMEQNLNLVSKFKRDRASFMVSEQIE